jgi:hypothetical protein
MGDPVRRTFELAVLTAATAAFAPLLAQSTYATLVGTVTDQHGAAIACVTVNVRNTVTGLARQVQPDDADSHRVYPLQGSAYDLTASVTGVQSKVDSNAVVDVAANEKVDFSVEVRVVSESLNVSANAAVLRNQDAALGGTITITQTGELTGKWPQFSQGWFYSGSMSVIGTEMSGAPLYAASEFEVVS